MPLSPREAPPLLCLPQPLASFVMEGVPVVPLPEPVTEADTGRVLVYATSTHSAPRNLRRMDDDTLDGLWDRGRSPWMHLTCRVIGSVHVRCGIEPVEIEPTRHIERCYGLMRAPEELAWASLASPSAWPFDCPLGRNHRPLSNWGFLHDYTFPDTITPDGLRRLARFKLDPQQLIHERDAVGREPQHAGGFGTALD